MSSAEERAQLRVEEGIVHEDAGETLSAETAYLEAAELAPDWSVPCFNLGLLYKRSRRWRDSLRFNLKAVELDPEDEGAWWNLGIAATALEEWDHARRAWRHFGLELPEGEGPFDVNLGPVPIRINPMGDGEVVWCHRQDLATAVILSVPLPASGHRYLDRLLHDGAPEGTRVWNDKEFPVFNELEILERSAYETFGAELRAPDQEALDRLSELREGTDVQLEDWTRSVRWICRECSEGTHESGEHVEPEPESEDDGSQRRDYGFAARTREAVKALLESWREDGPGRTWEFREA